MDYNITVDEMKQLLKLQYKTVPCIECNGRGVIYVCENGDVHPSRAGFEGTWFYDYMEQECEECNGLSVKVLLDDGTRF